MVFFPAFLLFIARKANWACLEQHLLVIFRYDLHYPQLDTPFTSLLYCKFAPPWHRTGPGCPRCDVPVSLCSLHQYRARKCEFGKRLRQGRPCAIHQRHIITREPSSLPRTLFELYSIMFHLAATHQAKWGCPGLARRLSRWGIPCGGWAVWE